MFIRLISTAALLFTGCMQACVAGMIGGQAESLGRGVVAVPAAQGMLVSWRSLGSDTADLAFNVYRGSDRLNPKPITDRTNFLDRAGGPGATYTVRPVQGSREQAPISATVLDNPYLKIAINPPPGGTAPDGFTYTYEANDGSVADLDGDGEYEIILKWQPTNARDNSLRGYTGNTIVDAYRLDGTQLWRIDLGRNIRAGAHYTTLLAYDLDGDGKAEIMMKTADGTVDGLGRVIGSGDADYRNGAGYILSGPEYLTVFNGLSGAALASTDYLPARGEVADWGDAYGNRVDRFLGTVACLDGTRPSAVFARGYYTRAVIVAWDWRDGHLSRRWIFDSGNTSGSSAYGQGAHHMSVADVDGDGKDEIIYGAATITHDGQLKYSTRLGHGDALQVGRFDPSRNGLQVVMAHENTEHNGHIGFEMHDASSGEILWSVSASKDIGRGLTADIDPEHAGAESWSTADRFLRSAHGMIIGERPSTINFAIWWDGDLQRELLDGTTITKWDAVNKKLTTLLNAESDGAASNNGTKATPVISADILGDWREEVVLRSADNRSLLLFTTPIETPYRIPTLMHDRQYRNQVVGQNSGYNQPPNPARGVQEFMLHRTPSAGPAH